MTQDENQAIQVLLETASRTIEEVVCRTDEEARAMEDLAYHIKRAWRLVLTGAN